MRARNAVRDRVRSANDATMTRLAGALVRPEKAEREKKGSAAEQFQQKIRRTADRYRIRMTLTNATAQEKRKFQPRMVEARTPVPRPRPVRSV